MLKTLYKKAFDIRDGEITISFFMQLYIFLVITVLLIVKPTVNALFLSALGAESLPYAYLLVAAVAISSSYYYNKALKKYSFKRVTIITLVSFSLLFILLSVALYFRFLAIWVLYFYYVLISLFAVIVTSQFWILANMVYNAREAKRLFGFIGAGAIAGGIFGGYLTTLVSANFGNKTSIFIAAVLIVLCVPILQRIWKLRLNTLSVYARKKKLHEESTPDKHAFQLILKSKHLLYIASIIGVGVLVAKLVDFQFSDFAHRAIPDSDELASFLGFWFSSFNVVALLIQLFLTNRVLSYLGVTSTMLILPLGIAIGCLLFLTVPELWVLIIIKGLDGSFKQSINKAAAELSILPIPYAIKNQAKSFIDIVVDSVATGLAGCLLIFVIKGMQLKTIYVTVLILFFLFVWIILIHNLKGAYFNSFRKNLINLLETDTKNKKGVKRETTITTARRILEKGDESEILTILERLASTKLVPLKTQIIKLLDYPSNKVKKAALSQLYYYREGTAINKVKSLIENDDDEITVAALQYLLHHTKIDDSNIFRQYLDHENEHIAGAALLCLAEDARNNKSLIKEFQLKSRIQDRITKLTSPEGLQSVNETAELLMTVANSRMDNFYYYISIHFSNTNDFVVGKAIKAAGLTSDANFIGKILPFLEIKKFRKRAVNSLTQYGPEITNTILTLENDEVFNENIRRYLPRVVASFNTQAAINILYKLLLSKDVATRRHASKSLQKLRSRNPNLTVDNRRITKLILRESAFYKQTINALATFTQLVNDTDILQKIEEKETDILIARESVIEVLRNSLEQSLTSIFTLLSLRYNQDDIKSAYFGLKSKDKEAKINAIEFLDNLLHLKLKSKILPLLEYNVIENDETDIGSYEIAVRDEYDVINTLIRNRGKKMKTAILYLIKELNDKRYKKTITKNILNHKDKDIQILAKEVLAKLTS